MSAIRPHAARARNQQGITLLEIMLVLAVLAFISVFVWPAVKGSYGTYRLRAAAEQVRAGLNKARNAAMTTGRVHMFRYRPESDNFAVQPWTGDVADAIAGTEASTASGGDRAVAANTQTVARVDHLVDGIRFQAGETAATARSQMVLENDQGMQEAGNEWASPVLFFADGTSVDAVIRVYNDRGNMVPVSVRGLNGTTRMGELQSMEGVR